MTEAYARTIATVIPTLLIAAVLEYKVAFGFVGSVLDGVRKGVASRTAGLQACAIVAYGALWLGVIMYAFTAELSVLSWLSNPAGGEVGSLGIDAQSDSLLAALFLFLLIIVAPLVEAARLLLLFMRERRREQKSALGGGRSRPNA